jgi:hypothetical protein
MMLYLGASSELPPTVRPELRVEPVDERRRVVEQWFTNSAVRFVGAHTGCSCGFPSVIAETPIEYYDGMELASDDRAADLRSVRGLLDLIRGMAAADSAVELYPVADGDEALPPRGVVTLQLDALDPDRFFFTERFMHVVHR